MFENVLDPSKVFELKIEQIDSEEVDITSLVIFKNLRSLHLLSLQASLDYILLITQMKASLATLYVNFKESNLSLNFLLDVLKECKLLRILTIEGQFNENDIIYFI